MDSIKPTMTMTMTESASFLHLNSNNSHSYHIVHPCVKPQSAAAVAAAVEVVKHTHQQQHLDMGRQQRANNTKKDYRLTSQGRKRKGDQLTLQGKRAFKAEQDCVVCHARPITRALHNYRIPKRPHHVLCSLNQRTKGGGVISQQNLATSVEEKHLKALYSTPLTEAEKCSRRFNTVAAGNTFFFSKTFVVKATRSMHPPTTTTMITDIDFFKAVSKSIGDSSFCDQHKNKSTPIAMLALATEAVDKVFRSKDQDLFGKYFAGLTMTVAESLDACNNPQYHSIVGHKLLVVDWIKAFGVSVPCPDACYSGLLKNTRTIFSKNKTLFPIFGLDTAPSWCIIMKMSCSTCKRDFQCK